MWLGVNLYVDGVSPTFYKAKTKKEVVDWFREMGYTETPDKPFSQGDGISYEMIDEGENVAFIVNLNAKK